MINKRLLNVLQVLFLVIFMSYESLLYVDAATTLKGNETMGSLRQTLKDLQAKQAAQNNKKNQTKNQIAQNKRNKAKDSIAKRMTDKVFHFFFSQDNKSSFNR